MKDNELLKILNTKLDNYVLIVYKNEIPLFYDTDGKVFNCVNIGNYDNENNIFLETNGYFFKDFIINDKFIVSIINIITNFDFKTNIPISKIVLNNILIYKNTNNKKERLELNYKSMKQS